VNAEERGAYATVERALEALAEWPDAFANNLLASVALDRLTQDGPSWSCGGEGYRRCGPRREIDAQISPRQPTGTRFVGYSNVNIGSSSFRRRSLDSFEMPPATEQLDDASASSMGQA